MDNNKIELSVSFKKFYKFSSKIRETKTVKIFIFKQNPFYNECLRVGTTSIEF